MFWIAWDGKTTYFKSYFSKGTGMHCRQYFSHLDRLDCPCLPPLGPSASLSALKFYNSRLDKHRQHRYVSNLAYWHACLLFSRSWLCLQLVLASYSGRILLVTIIKPHYSTKVIIKPGWIQFPLLHNSALRDKLFSSHVPAAVLPLLHIFVAQNNMFVSLLALRSAWHPPCVFLAQLPHF